ncbi:MAG: single-stranded DNA-binding protein [Candidatus Levybacteria bacterium]|nr:single-stranded DNA-binding protein [Candidatus Levybacteria bacterium]
MARSLNRVQLIGNLTRDPELRYTPSGTPVCTFSVATNRTWTTDSGDKKDEAEFHRIVAWNKLGEICSQFLLKGRKVYVEGRLATRSWQAQDGTQRSSTEVVISDMILLDSRRPEEDKMEGAPEQAEEKREPRAPRAEAEAKKTSKKAEGVDKSEPEEKNSPGGGEEPSAEEGEEEVAPDDIPF